MSDFKKMPLAGNQSARTKVHCFCIKCNGALVDPRMRNKHREYFQRAGSSADFRSEMENVNEMDDNEMEGNEMGDNEIDDNEMEYDPLPEITNPLPEVIYSFLTKKIPIHESENFQRVKKGKISERVLENLLLDDDDQNRHPEDSEDNDDQSIDFENSEDEEDSENDDYEEVNFASPDFDNNEPILPPNLSNDTYSWVIL